MELYGIYFSFVTYLSKCTWHSVKVFYVSMFFFFFLFSEWCFIVRTYFPSCLLFYIFAGQKSKIELTGLKARCQQRYILSEGSRKKFVFVLPAFLISLAGPFSLFKSSFVASSNISLSCTLWGPCNPMRPYTESRIILF